MPLCLRAGYIHGHVMDGRWGEYLACLFGRGPPELVAVTKSEHDTGDLSMTVLRRGFYLMVSGEAARLVLVEKH